MVLDAALIFQIVRGWTQEHSDPSKPLELLRARLQWPRRRSAEQREELAPFPAVKREAEEDWGREKWR